MACYGGGILLLLEISFTDSFRLFFKAYLIVGKTEIEKKLRNMYLQPVFIGAISEL